ncbi:hypothetical protein A5725_09640 [Mycobacterium kubicae]|nr:hypothetical protein A5725_09640 [Mycobacterium kubicae]
MCAEVAGAARDRDPHCFLLISTAQYISVPMVSKLAFTSATLGPLTLKNRFVKAATFEGVMPRGQMTNALIDFHTEVARGGAVHADRL